MYEGRKIEEAQYFYCQMCKELSNKKFFIYNLSAFLSAARSVIQYANKEVKLKDGGLDWYDNTINSSPILTFFRNERDCNIHDRPTNPEEHREVFVKDILFVSDSIMVVSVDGDSNGQCLLPAY